jgi:peptide/nickel transport system permease protein
MASMRRYLIKRVIYTVIIILIILTLIFILFEALPLKPMDLLRLNPQIKQSQIDSLTRQYGYDKSPLERYFIYMGNSLKFDLGLSFQYQVPVSDLISERLPRTLLLVGGSTIIAYAIGILVGAVMAWRRGGAGDASTVVTSLLFYNMPSFWLGLIFIYAFAFRLNWFPLAGFQDPESGLPYAVDILWHAALPMMVLTLISLAGTILLMRTSMLDVMNEPYMLTAVAKGLSPRKVLFKHGVRNAMLPVMTAFILSMAFSIGGAVITESVFSYQGLGQLFLVGLRQLDYPVAMGTTYVLSLIIVLSNFFADVIYGYLDPRVRLG